MYRKEVSKLNKEKFLAWKILMKLQLEVLGYYAHSTITTKHVHLVGAPTTDQLKQKKEHNQEILEIASSLSYSKFDEIKGCDTTKKMWDALHVIYGGDNNVLRAKTEILRGKFDVMRMQEGETIVQYYAMTNNIVNSIRGSNGKIEDETVIRRVLRTPLPIYAIRVSVIQELRCNPGRNLTLEEPVGRLTTFEL